MTKYYQSGIAIKRRTSFSFLLLFIWLFSYQDGIAQCTGPTDITKGPNMTVSTTGANTTGTYLQYYVLVDDIGNIVAANDTGVFATSGLTEDDNYSIHALNFDSTDPPSPLTTGAFAPSDLTGTLAGITGGCFDNDAATGLADDICVRIVAPAACVPTDVCEGTSFTATSSNATAGNTQWYMLVEDGSTTVLQANTDGVFNTTGLTGIHNVLALNFDPTDTPTSPAGVDWTDVSTIVGEDAAAISGGCFNADVLTDIVCFNILTRPAEPTIAANGPYCIDGTATALSSADAGTQTWYDSDPFAAVVAPLGAAPTPSTTSAGTTNYWLSVTDSNGCVSDTATIEVVVEALPVVTITDPGTICSDAATFALGGMPTGGTWDATPAYIDASGNFDPSMASIGTNTVTYTYTNTAAPMCSDMATFDVIVANCTCTPTDVCEGVSFTATSSNATAGNTQWYMLVEDGSTTVLQANTDGVFNTAGLTGIHNVLALNFDPTDTPTSPAGVDWTDVSTIVGEDAAAISGGCFNADVLTDIVCFNILTRPAEPTIAANGPYCIDGTATALSSADAGTQTWYDSDPFAAVVAPLGAAPTPSTTSAGTTNYWLSVTDSNGCVSDTATIEVVVEALPVVTITDPRTICSDAATFALGGMPTGGTWDATPAYIDASGNFDPSMASIGTNTVTYTYTNTAAPMCSDMATFDVIVANCTCTPTDVCEGVSFTATSSNATAGNTQWYMLVEDGSTTVLQANTDGVFNTAGLTGIHNVLALNFDPTDTPTSPAGVDWTDVSTIVGEDAAAISGGCFNADVLTDIVCFNILTRPAEPTIAANGPYCIDGTATALSSADAGTQTWYDSDPFAAVVAPLGAAPTPSTTSAGTTDYWLSVTDSNGCVSDTATIEVVVEALPVVTITDPGTICSDAATFALGGMPTGGTWDATPAYIDASGNFDPSMASIGANTVTYTYTNTAAPMCSNMATFEVMVINCICTPTDVCEGTSFTATSSNATAGNTQWYMLVEDGSTTVLQANTDGVFNTTGLTGIHNVLALNFDPTDTPTSPAGVDWTDVSTIVGEDAAAISGGCFNADVLTDIVCFNILTRPAEPTIAANGPYCIDGTATALSSADAGTQTWYDSDPFAAVVAPLGAAPTPSTTSAGTTDYWLSVTDSNGCVSDTATIEVVVEALPVVTITDPGTICSDAATFALGGMPTGGTWDATPAYIDASGNFDPSMATIGANTVTYTYTNTAAPMCSNMATFEVMVINCICTPTDVCEGTSFTATSSNATAGNTQWYMLVEDGSTTVLQANTDGVFNTTGLTGIHNVLALNFDPTDTPTSPAGVTWTDVSTIVGEDAAAISGGCFNADVLMDIVCVNVLTRPAEPTIAANGPYCIDGTATALSSADAGTQTWYDSDPFAAVVAPLAGAPTPSTTSAGTTDYWLSVTDGNGCVSDTATIEVIVNPLPVVDLGADVVQCVGAGDVTLDAGTFTSYLWSDASTNQTLVITDAVMALTTYTVTVTDANGCTNTSNADVTINALPVVDLGADVVQCVGAGDVTLDAGTFTSYLWSDASTNQTLVITDAAMALTTYTVTVTDANGCTNTSSSVDVTINPLTTLTNQTDTYCESTPGGGTLDNLDLTTYETAIGIPATLPTSPMLATVSWSPSSTATNVADGAVYTVTYTNENGCVSMATVTITIVASPTASIMGTNSSICEGSDATFMIMGTAGATLTYNINGATSTTTILDGTGAGMITVASPTSDQVLTLESINVGTPPNDCSTVLSGTQTVTVNAMPDPGLTTSVTVCNVGNGVSLVDMDAARGTADAGSWAETTATASGVSLADPTMVDFTGVTPGAYTFEYTATGTAPCTDEISILTVTVEACFDMALTKVINTAMSGAGPYMANDLVTFTIEVYNQGTVDAFDVAVTDYIPSGLLFTVANNPTWTGGTAAAPSTTIDMVVAGASNTVSIVLQVDPTFSGTTIVNNAEITFATNVDGSTTNAVDEDSVPNDNIGTGSELGSDGDITDNSTGGTDNPADNDDFDPAQIQLGACPAGCDQFPWNGSN